MLCGGASLLPPSLQFPAHTGRVAGRGSVMGGGRALRCCWLAGDPRVAGRFALGRASRRSVSRACSFAPPFRFAGGALSLRPRPPPCSPLPPPATRGSPASHQPCAPRPSQTRDPRPAPCVPPRSALRPRGLGRLRRPLRCV